VHSASEAPEQCHLGRVEQWVRPRIGSDSHVQADSSTNAGELLDAHGGEDTTLDPTDLRR
jgi:hypothetical protein